jgi:putative ABC transport system permease protein
LLQPVGTPLPVPIASTGPLPAAVGAGLDAAPITRVAGLRFVPGLGPTGGLINLRYADLAATDPERTLDAEVWLTSSVPAALLDRLREAGLVIQSDRTLPALVDLVGERGPALALRFYLLVAVASVALAVGGLAVVATADRWAQAGQLRALRDQGLRPGVGWRVGFAGYGALILVGLLLGTPAAAGAWWLSRAVIPFFTDAGGAAYLPTVPEPVPVAAALAGATAVLLAAAAVAAAGLRRGVEGGRP